MEVGQQFAISYGFIGKYRWVVELLLGKHSYLIHA